jgi:hypothetical protein
MERGDKKLNFISSTQSRHKNEIADQSEDKRPPPSSQPVHPKEGIATGQRAPSQKGIDDQHGPV